MRICMLLLALFLCFIPSASIIAEESSNQKTILAGKVKKARFKVQPPQWPTKHGDMHVCIWEDDKIACVTRAIDDNIPGEHEWWMKAGKELDMKFTWFVIVHPYVLNYEGGKGTNTSGFGKLEDFQKLLDAGHDVQGHGTGGINKMSPEDYEKDLISTKKYLNALKNNRVLVYAFPEGNGAKHRSVIAAKHYIAARGTTGAANHAAKTNYAQTADASWDPERIATLLDPKHRDYRGWISSLSHKVGMGDDKASKEASFKAVYGDLENAYNLRHKLWRTVYRKAAQYGQERDTHTLTAKNVTADEIQFDLTDQMHDELFDYPLTVKIALADSWNALSAKQGTNDLTAKIILHDGKKYALVHAVPDRGTVTVKKQKATQVSTPMVDVLGGRYKGSVKIAVSCIHSDAKIYYSTDGSKPSAASKLYNGAIKLTEEGAFDLQIIAMKDGLQPSEICSEQYTIWHDKTAPSIDAIHAYGKTAYVFFSEEMDQVSVEKATHYTVAGASVESVKLLLDQRSAQLQLSSAPTTIKISGLQDSSGNALTAADYQVISKNVVKDKSIVAHWSFDEPSGSDICIDISGNLAPGLLKKTGRIEGKQAGALSFDGGGKVDLVAKTNLGLKKTGTFTFSMWLRYDQGWKGSILATDYINPASVIAHYGKTLFRSAFRAGNTNYMQGKLPLPKAQWFHYALVGEKGRCVTYINGKVDTEVAVSKPYGFPATKYVLGNGFTGMIDELSIYNRALTAEEVQAVAEK